MRMPNQPRNQKARGGGGAGKAPPPLLGLPSSAGGRPPGLLCPLSGFGLRTAFHPFVSYRNGTLGCGQGLA